MKKFDSNSNEVEILFALNSAIANVPDPTALFHVIYETLRPLLLFEVAAVILPTENSEFSEIFMAGLSIPDKLKDFEKPQVVEMRKVIDFDPNSQEIFQVKYSEIMLNELPNRRELEVMERELGVRDFTLCPLPHGGSNIGFVMFGNGNRGKLSPKDFPFLKNISQVLASAVASTTSYAKLGAREQEARSLVHFTTMIMDIFESNDFESLLADALRQLHSFHYFYARGIHPMSSEGLCLIADRKGWKRIAAPELFTAMPATNVKKNQRVQICFVDRSQFSAEVTQEMEYHGVHALVQITMQNDGTIPCMLLLGCNEAEALSFKACKLFEQAAPQLYLALRNLQSWEQIEILRDKLQLENRALFEEITPQVSDKQMIGQSPAFRSLLSKARLVAPTDTTVLLLGETGTGKELLARHLHENSKRLNKPMVRVNCASLPAQLIESELFGHEKGSFTGAVEKRLGKFELADGGTLFLDEIGEMPLESQAKLLRVLQEHELERVGGRGVIPIDVRVIVATNRDLEKEVAKGSFRSDLFFRINTFPLVLPPLRERREDIGLLADMFLQRAAKKLGRIMQGFDRAEIDLLCSYNWPGNVRELEHVMENVAIISNGSSPNLREIGKYFKQASEPVASSEAITTLNDAMSNHIRTALLHTNGRVGGDKGAAALLGLNAKTLESKMRKLGIQRKVSFT